MKLFKKLSIRNRPRLNNQSGQAVVEYVLILIISVTLLFIARGFFSGLNNFMTSYVGDYFKCLMVQGELPALGVGDTDNLAKHTTAGYKCTVNYQAATSTPGTDIGGTSRNVGTAKPISTTQGSTKETAARRGPTEASKRARKPVKKTEPDELIGSSSGADFRFSSNVRNRSNSYNTMDAEPISNSVSSVRLSPSGYGDPDRYRTVSGRMQEDLLKNTRGGGVNQRRPSSRNVPLLSEDDQRPGPRRSKFMPPTRVVAAMDDGVDEPLTFGDFLKWLIIAGIGIALFVLIGGQVLSYSKAERE